MKDKFLEEIRTIAIIGVGLIGGSVGLALKKFRVESLELRVRGIGRHKKKLIKAKKMGAIDEWTTDFEKGVRNADLVVIATPVETIVPVVEKILPFVKKDCIITDVGSVKAPIVSEVEKILSLSPITHHLSPAFIGSHPLAGSEKSGIEYARSDLFHKAMCLLTPSKKTSRKGLEVLRKFWELLGAKVLILSPQLHDRLIARSSHLPHLLAAGLVNLVAWNKNVHSSQVWGPSFRDLTRVASSPPDIWAGICIFNRKEIIKAGQEFRNILSQLEKLLEQGKKKEVELFFTRARNQKKKILNG